MGFIFLTLAIYQAEAAWWGEGEGSNSQMPASAQQGNHWFMVSLPPPITLFLSCLFPSFPAVVVCLLLCIRSHYLRFALTPCGCSLHPILHHHTHIFTPALPFPHLHSSSIFFTQLFSYTFSLYCRTLGTTARCTSPRWRQYTWATTVAMPTATKTSIRHMCCRWMVSNSLVIFLNLWKTCYTL